LLPRRRNSKAQLASPELMAKASVRTPLPTTIRLELPRMRRAAAALLLLCVACAGQVPAPVPDTEVPQRKEILRNHRVTVSLLELAPREATPMHRHDRAGF